MLAVNSRGFKIPGVYCIAVIICSILAPPTLLNTVPLSCSWSLTSVGSDYVL